MFKLKKRSNGTTEEWVSPRTIKLKDLNKSPNIKTKKSNKKSQTQLKGESISNEKLEKGLGFREPPTDQQK